ncbi:MAG: IPT/TIG domain-containing protein [Solirubrobacteraceae bacterium]
MARTTLLLWRSLRLLAAILATALLAAGLMSGSAAARVAGAATPAVTKNKAPKVTGQPAGVTVEEGHSAAFEATASGVPTPTVQWEISTNAGSTWSAVAGATSEQLKIASAKTAESGDQYRAVFTNEAGRATSKAATLTVQLAPAVTRQPVGVTLEEGHTAVFEAAASGFPAPTVQWELSTNAGSTWSPVRRATSDQLTVASVTTSENGDEYRAVFTNAAGQATSAAATLTVHNVPKLTKQPVSVAVEEGQSATFEATASGFPAPTVQWEISTNGGSTWSAVEGATADQLTVASAKTSENGDEYRAVFTNVAGQATSAVATLDVHDPPAVTEQPVGMIVEVGHTAVLEASASGFPAPTVQWELSTNAGGTWTPVAGATADQLTIASAQASESGDEYRAVFTNVAGKATSEVATLTVATHHYRVVGWGQNELGQLGDGNVIQSDVPVPASGLNFVTAVAAGRRHSLALLSNGTVMAWGEGGSGQLGNGEAESSNVPVAVQGLSHVTAIAAGANQSLALLSSGTVMAWGGNESGQLGNGTTTESDVPVAVKGLTGVTAIAAGGEHDLALLSSGKVMAWGNNEQGQLGDGNTKNSDVPVAVSGLKAATAIAAGGEHSLALLSNGTVMAWGADGYGQLGNATAEDPKEEEEPKEEPPTEEEVRSEVPVQVSGVSGVTAIAAGARHSLALLSNGTVMAWGEDAFGELGDGSIVRSHQAPVAVSGLSGVTAIAAGGEHSLALLSDGTVATWGEDKYGELGNGTSGEPSDVPVAVSALGEVRGIVAGGSHDLAYTEPIPTVTAINPATGGAAGGTSVTIAGSNFEEVASVRFGASSATHFTVNSPTSITAVSPAGTVGTTVNVTVTTPAGTSATVLADRFSYVPAPTVASLSSKGGPGAGGTSVTITGSSFEAVTAVSFGASSAAHFTVNSPTSITAVSPAGAGTVDVTVTAAGGTSAISKHDRFGYTPAVEGVAPGSGPVAGGTSVTITGAGFAVGAGTTTFKFGSKRATAVNCASSTSCTAIAPANNAGTAQVTAAVGKLKSAANPPGDQFTYE